MLFPLKFVHSLVSGDKNLTKSPLLFTHFNNLDNDNNDDPKSNKRTPFLIFTPTQETVKDTYRLAQIARAIGMDLKPNPCLSHIIFSWPLSSPLLPFQNDTVPLPFPSFAATASLSHLRLFAKLTKGYFKLAFLKNDNDHSPCRKIESLSNYNWHCTMLSLYVRRTGERVESMDGFTKGLLGMGWTLFKTSNSSSSSDRVYLYRKCDVSRICSVSSGNGSRVRELRLPLLDFLNPPLRILQYILLMTDDVFYLA